ncbi:MAG: NUDIX domain-containing protein [Candidatus Kuenenbacteria bacterium]
MFSAKILNIIMTKTMKSKIIIVNENDKIIGYKSSDTLKKEDIYRVSALWVTNSHGEILLAKRHHTKSHHPRKWGPAVAGTVEKGETYKKNIIKEAEEELGIINIKPKLGPKVEINDSYHYFGQWYTLNINKNINEFKIQEDEVEEIKWFSPEELRKQLQKYPKEFLPTMKKYFELFFK